jgi:hypothetical protein
MLERLREIWKSDWQPIGKAAVIAWLVAYALFLLYALADKSGFLFLDHANLVVHEGGHLLVSWAGNQTFTVWCGTLLQWAVPRGGVVLRTAPARRLRVLHVRVLRKPALQRRLYGRRARHDAAAGHRG